MTGEMNVIWRSTKSLKPYEHNQKKHSKTQIANVAESIRRFGWQQPIVIDKDGVVVIGHCRLLAAKKLKLESVPCVCADWLTDDQIRELRIVDNKTNESEWDLGALALDMQGLSFDGMDFKFDFPDFTDQREEAEEDGYFGDERERTFNRLRLNEFDPDRTDGWFQMPTLEQSQYIPESLTAFHEFVGGKETDTVHFFLDDYQFERIWSYPQKYIDMMIERGIRATLTPDFSTYTDMPEALKIYNVFRNRLIGQMMQDAGLEVIPTLQWAQESTFAYCFDGVPKGGTVAVSMVGVTDGGDMEVFEAGMREALRILEPKTVLVYGSRMPDFNFGVDTRFYKAFTISGKG